MAKNNTASRAAEFRTKSTQTRRGSNVGNTPVQSRQSAMGQFSGQASSAPNRALKGPDKGRGAKG